LHGRIAFARSFSNHRRHGGEGKKKKRKEEAPRRSTATLSGPTPRRRRKEGEGGKGETNQRPSRIAGSGVGPIARFVSLLRVDSDRRQREEKKGEKKKKERNKGIGNLDTEISRRESYRLCCDSCTRRALTKSRRRGGRRKEKGRKEEERTFIKEERASARAQLPFLSSSTSAPSTAYEI